MRNVIASPAICPTVLPLWSIKNTGTRSSIHAKSAGVVMFARIPTTIDVSIKIGIREMIVPSFSMIRRPASFRTLLPGERRYRTAIALPP